MKYKNILLCLLAASLLPSLALAKKGKGPKHDKAFGKIDSNGDEIITLEEAESAGADKFVEHFNEIDADGSGEITKDELRVHHKQRMEERRAKREAMDADSNGSISLDEATNAGADKLVENFDKIDANGDGEIDCEEMNKAHKDMRRKKKIES